jgi:hypothetical protein
VTRVFTPDAQRGSTRLTSRLYLAGGTNAGLGEAFTGIKWSARLAVDFEMNEGVAVDLAERRLRESAIEFQRHIEFGHNNGRTRVKPGSAKVTMVAQGQIP